MARSKKILLSTLSLNIGGAEVFTMALASELSKQNEVFVFYHNEVIDDPSLAQKYLSSDVTVLSMNNYPIFNFLCWKINALLIRFNPRFSFHDYARRKLLRHFIRKYHIELVNNHTDCYDVDCIEAAHGQNIPVVLTEHGGHSSKIHEGKLESFKTINQADYIITVSDFNKQLLVNQPVSLNVPVSVIYNGIQMASPEKSVSARTQLRIAPDDFVFGMVSRGIPGKGWEEAIKAFLQLKSKTDKTLYLILVGGSTYLDELKVRYIDEPSIIFTGRSSNPFYYIDGFDVGLLPTLFKTESLPLTIIEYFFCEKPVIATNTGGVPELLKFGNKELGQLIDFNEAGGIDIDDLCNAMLRYIDDHELYDRHKEASSIVRTKFTMKECAKEYDLLFDEIIRITKK